jgi:hypothetical protein
LQKCGFVSRRAGAKLETSQNIVPALARAIQILASVKRGTKSIMEV